MSAATIPVVPDLGYPSQRPSKLQGTPMDLEMNLPRLQTYLLQAVFQ